MILIGVDAHRDTHTAAVVDRVTGERVDVLEVRARAAGHRQLLVWASASSEQRLWAIDNPAHNLMITNPKETVEMLVKIAGMT